MQMKTRLALCFLLSREFLASGFQIGSKNVFRGIPWDAFPNSSPIAMKAEEVPSILENSYYITMDCDGDFCLDNELVRPEPHAMDLFGILNIAVPALTPILSFLLYEEIAQIFSFTIDILGPNTWIAVDGGAYQAKIIAPAINGVVVPAIAVLFATLTSTTISSLRERQVSVRNSINMEAGELRALEVLMESVPSGAFKSRARDYLIQYTSRIISESSPGSAEETVTNPRHGMDSELNAFVTLLNQEHSKDPHGFLSSYIISETFSSVSKLREQRQSRITALQSTFPTLHYIVLGLLAFAQCTAFLMETNTQSLLFLNALQLRILWSMLTSTFVACFAVFSDMRTLFSGSYQILPCVDQLYIIRLTLQASAQMDEIKEAQAEQQRKEEEEDQLEKLRLEDEELAAKELQEAEEEEYQIYVAAPRNEHVSRQRDIRRNTPLNGKESY